MKEVEQVQGIAPPPTIEVIAVGKLAACGECEDGRVEDTGLSRIPFRVMIVCPTCGGRGRYPQFTAYNPGKMW